VQLKTAVDKRIEPTTKLKLLTTIAIQPSNECRSKMKS